MVWEEALELINNNIYSGLELNPELTYRRLVIESPPYLCRRFNYLQGFKVQIGQNTFIEVPIEMLHNIFNASLENNNIYSRNVFRYCYPGLGDNSTGHGCYIHTIGKIFQISHVGELLNNRYYSIL